MRFSYYEVRSGRCYSSYLAPQTVRGAADSTNKHVTNGSMLQLRTIKAIPSEILLALVFTDL